MSLQISLYRKPSLKDMKLSSPDIAAISGLNASLKWIKEIGIQNIYDKEQANHERLLKILSRFENIKLIDTAKQWRLVSYLACLRDMAVTVSVRF